MEIDLSVFHFIRPAWLWLLVPAFALPWFWFRRNDVRHRWRNIIEPALLEHLIVGENRQKRIRPVHILGLLIGLGAVSAAGPTWQRERPPFGQDQAPLVVVLELAHSMDATDISPTRLERAKQKILALAHARRGARTGLIVFAASAHLVVPPTDDASMLELYVPALSPSLMPADGKNAAAGLREAERLLDRDPAAGTIVFISDGFDEGRASEFLAAAKGVRHQLLWLAVGSEDGAPIRADDGTIAMDAAGHPLRGSFNVDAIRSVAHDAGVPLASLRADDDDIAWVRHRAQAWLAQVEQSHVAPRWKEAGYWLVFPLIALALWSFRKGWTVKWLPAVVLGLSAILMPHTAHAGSWQWIDAFATHDQQGRWYFEHHDFKTAAQRFDDPMWKGRSQYLAGDFTGALESFSRLKTADAYFYLGNTLAHLDDYAGATQAYENALKIDPHLKAAEANIDLMRHLIAEDKRSEYDPENDKPDQVVKDKRKGQGTKAISEGAPRPTEEVWLRNLNTSPALFLRQRFAVESQ
ncbi:Ca-activated chloride channel homolog [Pararobbsia alpina]|uniref:vWA domain-containing protein n=1 Tax=Pararobbsia alpina TaxID=621374 RepID=UPI0039A59F7D